PVTMHTHVTIAVANANKAADARCSPHGNASTPAWIASDAATASSTRQIRSRAGVNRSSKYSRGDVGLSSDAEIQRTASSRAVLITRIRPAAIEATENAERRITAGANHTAIDPAASGSRIGPWAPPCEIAW